MTATRGQRRGIWLGLTVAALAVAPLAGCRSARHQTDSADLLARAYDKAKLEYKIDAGKLNVPIELARIEGQAVSYDHLGTMPLPDQAVGTLTLEYPHPDKHVGFVKARLEIRSSNPESLQAANDSKRWWNVWSKSKRQAATDDPQAVVEVWEVDIPRTELDGVLAQLNRQGYFDKEVSGSGGVELDVKVGPRESTKRWQQVAELDALMLRARGQGRLVAYQRPHAPPSAPPSAVLAYQDWQQGPAGVVPQTGAPAQPPMVAALPAPATNMPPAPYAAAVPYVVAAQAAGNPTEAIGTPVRPVYAAAPGGAPTATAAAFPAETPLPGAAGYAPGFAPAPQAGPALPYGTAAAPPAPTEQRRF